MSEPLFKASGSNSATFSDDLEYRYTLGRRWGTAKTLVVIGLNPSTADENEDDPTIRRCMGFAKRDGYNALLMLNLFAFRATDPRSMMSATDPVGPLNNKILRERTLGRDVLVAWGALGSHRGRDREVMGMLEDARRVLCLGVTKAGQPKHPLYLRADTPLAVYPPLTA